MRKRLAYKVLKKYDLMDKRLTLRQVSMVKNVFHRDETWVDFIKWQCLSRYFGYGKPLPDEGVFIKEIGLQLGGTMTVTVGAKE